MRIRSFAALGDSFTAGRESAEGERWPDRIAAGLRAEEPQLRYANLAVDGAGSAEVLEQVPAALELRPELVTVICGANDVLLTTRPDVEGYEERFAAILERLREGAPEAAIATATAPEAWHFMELRPRTEARLAAATAALNAATREIAARHDVFCLPVAGDRRLEDPDNFSADGLHASPTGHELIAREIARIFERELAIEIDHEAVLG